jgi:hypothetical protein
MDTAPTGPIEGEARLKIDGGLGSFPGLSREQVVRFCDLPPGTVDALVRSAKDACFFDQPDAQGASRPDARTYTLCLTIGQRSHRARLSEPIENPALAHLVSTIRQLARHQLSSERPD